MVVVQVRITLLGAILVSSIALGGCAGLKKPAPSLTPAQQQEAAVEATIASGDLDRLGTTCADTSISGTLRERACAARLEVVKTRWAAMKDSCDGLVDGYDQLYAAAHDDLYAQTTKFVRGPMTYQAAMKFAECGFWEKFFGDMISVGPQGTDALGTEMLVDAEKAGRDVEGQLFAYLDAHASDPFGEQNGELATSHVVSWMHLTNRYDAKLCPRVLSYAKASKPDRLDAWLTFLANAGCTAALPLAEPRLTDAMPGRRVQACEVMGKLATKKDLPKLQAVATSDPEFTWNNTVQVFFVRDACKNAITAVTVRGR